MSAVVMARALGYCRGVRRALRLALDENKSQGPGKVWTYGELIHNESALKALEAVGIGIIRPCSSFPPLTGRTVVLCAHGVTPAVERGLRALGATVVDATCPVVKNNQRLVERVARVGDVVFIAGEAGHAEVVGLRGYAAGTRVVETARAADEAARALYAASPAARVSLVAQTTLAMPLYQDIADAVYRWFPSVRMWDTICGATMARQQALRELCKRVDAVVVAGSLRSSNTAHLADIAKGMGLPTFLVETADALPAEAFAYGTVGLTAGASTPEHIIDKIRAVLETGAQTAASGVNYF